MNIKSLILLIPMLLLLYKGASGQSIEQSVQSALDNNASLKSQKVLLDNSYQNFLLQNGKLLPNLSLNSTGSRSSNLNTNQETDSYSVSINSSYMLFDFGSLSAKKRSAQHLNDASKVSFKKLEKDLIMSVVKVHLELFKAIKIVELYENSLEIRKQQFLAVKNRFDLGEATRSDLLRSKASISGAEAQLNVAQANVKKFREGYKTLVGRAPETPKLPKMITTEPKSLESSVKVALENDLGLKVLMLEEQALKEELSAAEKSRLPNLSLSGELSYGDSPTLGSNYSSGRISLTSNLTLYSGGQKKAQVKIASNNLAAKAIDIAVRKKFLERDVITKWLDLMSLRSTAAAKQEEATALKELYESVFEEWKLGGKTSLDTDQAYQNFLNSEVDLVTTSTDILVAKFDLLAEIGTLRTELRLR
ncbi:TolC family protein [Paracoccaceae bacterium]|nr:TolC family protein [Paracoccaceae bacterium]